MISKSNFIIFKLILFTKTRGKNNVPQGQVTLHPGFGVMENHRQFCWENVLNTELISQLVDWEKR